MQFLNKLHMHALEMIGDFQLASPLAHFSRLSRDDNGRISLVMLSSPIVTIEDLRSLVLHLEDIQECLTDERITTALTDINQQADKAFSEAMAEHGDGLKALEAKAQVLRRFL